MTYRTLLLMGCALGCAAESNTSSSTAQLQAALSAAVERDADAVTACEAQVARCEAASLSVDAGPPASVCTRHAERCEALTERLSEVRKPLVECLEDAISCEDGDDGPDACEAGMGHCQKLDDQVREERHPYVKCVERVDRCEEEVDAGQPSSVTCENQAQACDRMLGAAADAAHARNEERADARGERSMGSNDDEDDVDGDSGDDDADDIDVDDDDADEVDIDEDDVDDVDEGGRDDRPESAPGQLRGRDAGAPEAE